MFKAFRARVWVLTNFMLLVTSALSDWLETALAALLSTITQNSVQLSLLWLHITVNNFNFLHFIQKAIATLGSILNSQLN